MVRKLEEVADQSRERSITIASPGFQKACVDPPCHLLSHTCHRESTQIKIKILTIVEEFCMFWHIMLTCVELS